MFPATGRRMTYAEVERGRQHGRQPAGRARASEPGDKVALSCPNLPYFSLVYCGILKAGATVVPLNVLLKGREVAYHLDDSDAKAYFCFEGTARAADRAGGVRRLPGGRGLRALLRDHRRPWTASRRSRASRRFGQALGGMDATFDTRRRPTRTTPRSSSTPRAPPASPRAPSCGTATCATTPCSARRSSGPTPENPDTLPVRAAAVPLLRPDRDPERRLRRTAAPW